MTIGEGFNILGSEVRVVARKMVEDGMKLGAPLPCDKEMLIDLSSHAAESALRVLADHVDRSGLPNGGDVVMMALICKLLGGGLDLISDNLKVVAVQAMRDELRQ
jgi:hypothetical protein